jgi:phosphoribosylamine--glycine ligase
MLRSRAASFVGVKVLIIGGGGREHALAWKLKQEAPDAEIVAAPGNPGIATLGRCVPVAATDIERLVALAEHERPNFTLVGPEAPLALGVVDRFRERRLPIFGPTRAAAQIETSKAFAKQLMLDAGVPTALAFRHTEPASAKRAARELGAPVVIKASGLAAGKGVIVCQTLDEADRAIDFMLRDEGFGAAGAEILVEEFMDGEELSIFYVTDGTTAVPLVPAQDHKRLLDGDRGPNTGGMGAYTPPTVEQPLGPFTSETGAAMTDALHADAVHARAVAAAMNVQLGIVEPTLTALRERGSTFNRAPVRGTHAHRRRTESRRVQLPVWRSRDAGRVAGNGRLSRRVLTGCGGPWRAPPRTGPRHRRALFAPLRAHDRARRCGLPRQAAHRRPHNVAADR